MLCFAVHWDGFWCTIYLNYLICDSKNYGNNTASEKAAHIRSNRYSNRNNVHPAAISTAKSFDSMWFNLKGKKGNEKAIFRMTTTRCCILQLSVFFFNRMMAMQWIKSCFDSCQTIAIIFSVLHFFYLLIIISNIWKSNSHFQYVRRISKQTE